MTATAIGATITGNDGTGGKTATGGKIVVTYVATSAELIMIAGSYAAISGKGIIAVRNVNAGNFGMNIVT